MAAIIVALSTRDVVAILINKRLDTVPLLIALRARFPDAEVQYDRAATREAVNGIMRFVEHPQRTSRCRPSRDHRAWQ